MNRFNQLALAAAFVFTACVPAGQGSNTTINTGGNTTQVPVVVKGSLVGRITDNLTGLPVVGATVKVVGPTIMTATTDAAGFYVINDVPSGGGMTAYAELAEYIRGICGFTIDDTAGGSPLQGGVATCNFVLGKATASIVGHVIYPNGAPANGAELIVDMRNNGFDAVVSTKSAADGTFKLSGLVSSASGIGYTIRVSPFDENGDGNPDYNFTNVGVNVTNGPAARVIITLNNIGNRPIVSNVFDFDIAPTDDITMEFLFPVFAASPTSYLVRDQFILQNLTRNNNQIPLTATWTGSTKVALKPSQALTAGDRYRITWNLQNVGGGNFSSNFDFQVRSTMTPGYALGNVTNFRVSSTNGQAQKNFNYNTNNFWLSWDGVAGDVTEYVIYAKDDHQVSQWVRITSVGGYSQNGHFEQNVGLLSTFDNYLNDGNTQPLGANNTVTFAVVPVDRYGNLGPIAMAPTDTARDTVVPTQAGTNYGSTVIPTPLGTADGINEGTTAQTFWIRVYFNEPMGPAAPTLTLSGTGGTSTFQWDPATNHTQGVFTVTLAPGADVTGPWAVRGAKDMAGNSGNQTEIVGSLQGMRNLLSNGDFDSGNCASLTGWTPAATLMSVAPSGQSYSTANGSACGAVLGYPAGTTPMLGNSRMYQEVLLPTIPVGSNWYFYTGASLRPYTRAFNQLGSFAVSTQCRITDVAEMNTYYSMNFGANNDSTSFSNWGSAGSPGTGLAGTTVRFLCEANSTGTNPANGALFVDNAVLALIKN